MKKKTEIIVVIVLVLLGLVVSYVVAFVPLGPSTGSPIGKYKNPSTALVVMDMQVDFLGEKAVIPVAKKQTGSVIDAVNSVVKKAMKAGMKIVYVRNAFSSLDVIGNMARNGAAIRDSDGARMDPRVQIAGNSIFDKRYPDAFSNRMFSKHLEKNHVNHIIVAGVFADQCVMATVKAALNRKYEVSVLKDAVAAADRKSRDSALEQMKTAGAKIISSDQL